MTHADWIRIVVAVVLTIVAMWFAAVEAAFHSMARARANELVEAGVPGSALVLDIAEDPAPTINTSTLLRMIAQVMTALLIALVVFDHIKEPWAELLVAGVVLLLLWFIVWGVGPQTLGRQKAVWVATHSARLMNLLTTVFGPVAQLLIAIGNAVTPGRGFTDGPFTTEAELRDLVDYAEDRDLIEEDEADMIHSVFELGDTIVREVMVPRTDVLVVESGMTLRQGLLKALQSGYSRIPVTGETLDDIVGVLHVKDIMARVFYKPEAQRKELVRDIMRPASFCPDSKPVDKLLRDMQATRTHMMIVVDEFGGMAGIVTLEDIVEEIVGEITDEYDAEPVAVEALGDGAYRVPARLALDELSELMGVDLEDEEVETAAGLMGKVLSKVPTPGARVDWRGLEFVADQATGRRHQIATLVVRPVPEVANE